MSDLSKMNLDPDVPESTGGFTVFIPGKYVGVLVKDKLVDTKNKNGKVWKLRWQITEGEYLGESVEDNINLLNPSKECQVIGQGTAKRICNIHGVKYPPENTKMQLYGKPTLLTIKNEEFKSNKTDKMLKSNKITAYNPVSEKKAEPKKTASSTGSSW